MARAERPTWVVDVDDTKIAHVAGFVTWLNTVAGTNLRPEDYREDFPKLLGIPETEACHWAIRFHSSGVLADFDPVDGAPEGIATLAEAGTVISLTSRRRISRRATEISLGRHFGSHISGLYLTGIYDDHLPSQGARLTKTEWLRRLGADAMIDDQEKHCFDAAAHGIPAILFGEYNWHETSYDSLPPGVIHCPTWKDVIGYGIAQCMEMRESLSAA